MVVEMISWPVSTKECCRVEESIRACDPHEYQSDAHSTEIPEPSVQNMHLTFAFGLYETGARKKNKKKKH